MKTVLLGVRIKGIALFAGDRKSWNCTPSHKSTIFLHKE
jgi:hypothetical protein